MKLNINIDELKATTQAAIDAAENRRLKKLAEIKAKDEREAKAALLKAEGIIAQIPSRCAKEAEHGRNHALAMSLKHSDYNHSGPPHNQLPHDKLNGAAAHVWNACQEAGMNPTLEHWHDGGGMKSGFNVVVRWGDEFPAIDSGSVDCPPQLRD
jgi:hypothetical protein